MYNRALCMRPSKALASLNICAYSPEPALLTDTVSAIISCIDTHITFTYMYKCTFDDALWVFRRHDLVVLILSCIIFVLRRHYNVMCDFFQQ